MCACMCECVCVCVCVWGGGGGELIQRVKIITYPVAFFALCWLSLSMTDSTSSVQKQTI